MGGRCKVKYIPSKGFFDDTKHSVSRYYLKNLYLRYVVLVSRIKGFETIARRGAFSVVKKLFIRRTAFTLTEVLIAFTLAEVLIVLGIIGLIADMTIPTLQQNISEKVNITALKKAHSTFENAFRLAVQEYGTPDNWTEGAPIDVADGAEERLLNKLSYSMRVLKNCGIKTDCLPEYTYKYMNGGPFKPFNTAIYAKAQLADGMLFAVDYAAWDCSGVVGTTIALKNMCGYVMVDVNGHKKPNVAGKDFFAFYLTKYGIIPIGSEADTFTNYKFDESCKSSGNGWGCTAWALYNGNMDYYKCDDLSWAGKKSCK